MCQPDMVETLVPGTHEGKLSLLSSWFRIAVSLTIVLVEADAAVTLERAGFHY